MHLTTASLGAHVNRKVFQNNGKGLECRWPRLTMVQLKNFNFTVGGAAIFNAVETIL